MGRKNLILLLLPLFFVACQRTPEYRTPFERAGKKIMLSVDGTHYESENTAWVFVQKFFGFYQEKMIPKGTQLALLIDETCSHFYPAEFSSISRSKVQTHKITLNEEIPLSALQAYVGGNPCLLGVSNNRKADASDAGATQEYVQRHWDSIRATQGFPEFFDAKKGLQKDVVIAVVDTGIDLTHPDLKDQLWVNQEESRGQAGVDDDRNGYVDDIYGYNFADHVGDPSHKIVNDHGTHVSGLATAALYNKTADGKMQIQKSSAPHGRLKIMSLNVFGSYWGTETVSIDEAIRYAADNGANVINISVGGPGKSDTTAAAIAYALSKNVLVVTSVGNLTQDIEQNFYYPASYSALYKGMLSVAASESSNYQICDFSSFSKNVVKIVAPGCDLQSPASGLLSTRKGSSYGYRKGTSMSTPLVAGAVAMAFGILRDRLGSIQAYQVEDYLLHTSSSLAALAPYAQSGRFLNIETLVKQLNQDFPVR